MVFAYGETSPMVEAVEAGVSHEGSFGKYGAVKSGRLKLQGFLTDATHGPFGNIQARVLM
jgi:hypothetical protein